MGTSIGVWSLVAVTASQVVSAGESDLPIRRRFKLPLGHGGLVPVAPLLSLVVHSYAIILCLTHRLSAIKNTDYVYMYVLYLNKVCSSKNKLAPRSALLQTASVFAYGT